MTPSFRTDDKIESQSNFNLQVSLTALMIDVCAVFRYIEKETQKPDIIVPDILRYRDIALEKLNLLKDKLCPGNTINNTFSNTILILL